jgi:hypothetical protein
MSGLLGFIHHTEASFLEQQVGRFQLEPQIKEIFLTLRGPEFLSDFVSEGGGEGHEPARGRQPHCHWLNKEVRLPIENAGE